MGKNMKNINKSILGQRESTTVKHQSTTVNASQSVGDIIVDVTGSIIESGSDLVWVRRWRHGWCHRLLACVARVTRLRSGSGAIGSPDPVKNMRTLWFFRRLNDIVLTFYKSPYPLCFFFVFSFLSPKLQPKFSRESSSRFSLGFRPSTTSSRRSPPLTQRRLPSLVVEKSQNGQKCSTRSSSQISGLEIAEKCA